jgi:hypothetical protein
MRRVVLDRLDPLRDTKPEEARHNRADVI